MINLNTPTKQPEKVKWYRLARILLICFFISLIFIPFGIWFQAFILLIIFLGLPIYIYLWIDYNRTTFVVEDNKITLNWGIIEKYSKSVAFNNVQNITNARGILSQFLGLSKINIWTSSPSQIEIRGKESENRPELFLQLEYSDGEWLKNFILDKRSK